VQYLHGSGVRETVGLREEVWDPFQLQPHVLLVLHPAVEVCQAVRESHHQVSRCSPESVPWGLRQGGARSARRCLDTEIKPVVRDSVAVDINPAVSKF